MKNRFSRRNFLRGTVALGFGAVGTSLLSACAPPTSGTAAEVGESGATGEVIEIRVQTPGNRIQETEFSIDEFNKRQGEIVAISETIPYNELVKKTEVGFVSGTLQDCVYGHNKWYKFNAYRGVYMGLDELIDSNPPDDFADFFPLGIEGLRFEGTLYCLPSIIKPGPVSALYWNKNLLADAGIDEPDDTWTLMDVEEAARAVTDPDNGIFGFECPFDSDLHRLACITRAFGDPTTADKRGWPIDEEGKKFRLLEPLISDAMPWLINMVNDQVMPRGADDIEGGLFDSGRIAFQIASIGELVRYNETSGDRFEVGYMVQPPGPDGRRGSCIEGNQWMLNSQTAQVDGAWEVLKALTDKESNVWGAVNSTKIPARKSAYLDPKVNEVNPLYGLSVPIMEEWLEPFPMVWNLRYNEVFQVYAQELAFVVEGEKSWDEYANTIYDKVQEIVDEDRPPKAIG